VFAEEYQMCRVGLGGGVLLHSCKSVFSFFLSCLKSAGNPVVIVLSGDI
jgi:hypothetical protein